MKANIFCTLHKEHEIYSIPAIVEIKSISEKKRRRSDLVIMWQSILDLSLCVLDKCWAILNNIWETTKIWIKADDQREIMTWLEKHLPAVPRDFSYSWRDGVLLSVLLNKLRPGCFPDAENLDPEYGLKNVYRALNVLEARFKIVPKVIAEEIVTCCHGSDQKLQDLLLRLKQETDKGPLNNAEEQCERTESSPPETTSDTCIARGTGLLGGIVGREANFVVHFAALSELDLVVEIRGPSNELCSERITKRSPKRKQSVRNWRPSPPCLERSHSESIDVPMPGAEEDAAKKPQESRHIPMKYEIRANQVSFTYTPFTKGRHKVSILYHGQHITDSPYSVAVEPQVGTYKSGLKSVPKIDDEPKKECAAVRIQVPEENKRSFGNVVKRRVLRYIVKIDKKEIVVDTDSIDQLASALLKMDYELQKRPVIRRNSWGFVGDAERKVSMIRQFCVDVEELEAQSLKMHRSHSLTIVPKPKKAFPKNASYECEDILGRSRLGTVTKGKDRKMSSHREEEEEVLAYLNEEFDSDKPARDESTKSENAMEISRFGEETTIQPTLLPFSWPSHGVSSASEQRREEILESGEIQPDSDIETHRGSESSGPLFLSSSASNLSFSQSMEASLENDLNTEWGKTKAGGAGDVENNHPHCPDSEIFCSDAEDPFTKIVVKNLGNKFVCKENSVHRIMEDNELNKNPPENVQLFNFYPQNTNEVNSTNNKQYNSSPYKNVDSRQVFVPSCCGNRRQRSCHYKTHKHRNNYKNCVIKPLNVVYFPVYKDYFYKRSPKNFEVKLEKRSRNNDQNVSINSNFGQKLSKQNHHPMNTSKETLTVKSSSKKMNETDTNYHSKSMDVTKISDSSSTKQQQNFPSKSFNTNVNEAYKIVPNFQELNSLYTRPYKNNHFEPNYTSNAAQLNSKDSTKQFSIIKQPLVPLGQFHYKHFNPVIANKKDGRVKLRVKQWQKHMCEEPQKVKVVQKADTLPEKGNLTVKLKFWENVQRENNEASSDEPSSLKCRQNVNETLQKEKKDHISENSTSILLNIIDTPTKASDAKPSKSKENLCLPSHNQDPAEKPNDKLVIPTTPRVRKRSFSDPGNFESSAFHSSDVSDLLETLPEPIRKSLSSSSDVNYLELSADDELSSVDLLYSTEDEYIDDEISDTASTYWGDLSFIKDLKLADSSAYREFCSLVDSKYLTDRRDGLDSCPYECQVYGIANYFGHVAVKNRFRVLTNGAGCGNLSATVQGLGHHEVSFVSVEYVQKDVYEVTYQVLTPGLYLIAVRWMESPISGSPFLCKVTF